MLADEPYQPRGARRQPLRVLEVAVVDRHREFVEIEQGHLASSLASRLDRERKELPVERFSTGAGREGEDAWRSGHGDKVV